MTGIGHWSEVFGHFMSSPNMTPMEPITLNANNQGGA